MLEKEIEKRLIEEVEKLNGLCLKLNSQSANGIPDRLILLPNGRVYFTELKKYKKKLDPLQRYWRKKLQELGFISLRIDSLVAIEKFIESKEVIG